MEPETSTFETSEMLATFLTSTPLLTDSWSLCCSAHRYLPGRFCVETKQDLTYIAFAALLSGPLNPSDPSFWNLVPLDGNCERGFAPLCGRDDTEESTKVSKGVLDLFYSILPLLKLSEILGTSQRIVITGHTVGGLVASLLTLWLLSYLRTRSSSHEVFCITFGSPFLGNKSLSRSILRERWGFNFCHVSSNHDIMPRLLFARPSPGFAPLLERLFHFWTLSITSHNPNTLHAALTPEEKTAIFRCILESTGDGTIESEFWPYGTYIFCSKEGSFGVDDPESVVKMMHLMLTTGIPDTCIQENLMYEQYIQHLSSQVHKYRGFSGNFIPETSQDAGLLLTLDSSGISQLAKGPVAEQVKDCLVKARKTGRDPIQRCAELAIRYAATAPYRLEIQRYKDLCDKEQMSYYDAFKCPRASKKYFKVNMNREKLNKFWDNVIRRLEANEFPHDFEKRKKWVCASQFYMLLVEPLDIAHFYKNRKSEERGRHYIREGRNRRYKIFERWWTDRNFSAEKYTRTRYASLTQDSLFWARVEEAKENLSVLKTETEPRIAAGLWKDLLEFKEYAKGLVRRMEVSVDVLAENSSYSIWERELERVGEHSITSVME